MNSIYREAVPKEKLDYSWEWNNDGEETND